MPTPGTFAPPPHLLNTSTSSQYLRICSAPPHLLSISAPSQHFFRTKCWKNAEKVQVQICTSPLGSNGSVLFSFSRSLFCIILSHNIYLIHSNYSIYNVNGSNIYYGIKLCKIMTLKRRKGHYNLHNFSKHR